MERIGKKIVGIVTRVAAAVAFTVTILETIEAVHPIAFRRDNKAGIIIVAGVVIPFLYHIYEILKTCAFTCKVDDDMYIKIRIGNILHKRKGTILVGINDQLETDADKIGPNSIHRQLVKKCRGDELKNAFCAKKASLNGEKADIGVHFQWNDGHHNYLFLVMSTMLNTSVPYATEENLSDALATIFQNQNSLSISHKVLYAPVLGAGDASVQTHYCDIVRLLAKEYIISRRQCNSEAANRIQTFEIVVYWKDFFRKEIWAQWSTVCKDIDAMARVCSKCKR